MSFILGFLCGAFTVVGVYLLGTAMTTPARRVKRRLVDVRIGKDGGQHPTMLLTYADGTSYTVVDAGFYPSINDQPSWLARDAREALQRYRAFGEALPGASRDALEVEIAREIADVLDPTKRPN